MTANQVSILDILYSADENSNLNRNKIVQLLSNEFSKVTIVNALHSLYFVGFIDYHSKGNKHYYFMTEEGYRFSQYAQDQQSEDTFEEEQE